MTTPDEPGESPTGDGDPDSLEKQLNARYPIVGYLFGLLAFVLFMIGTYTCAKP